MHRFSYVLTILSLLFCCQQAFAQNYPVYNSYYVNPYLYNPAEVATENTYLFLNRKQQWLGIEGAPTLSTLSFNTLLNETRSGIGIKASNYSRGILSSTDFSLTYAYGILLNKQKSTLFFGMSAGAITNSLDLTQLSDDDLNDPVIANYLANNIQPVANFGVLFRSPAGLNFGLILPQLFAPSFNLGNHFEAIEVSPLDNAIVSLYYKRKVEGKLVNRRRRGVRAKVRTADAYAPLELYTMYKYSAFGNSQFEVNAKINLSPNFWLGAGYRQEYGFTANTGIAYGNLIVGYSYEPGSQPEAGFSKGTHEVVLGLKLGKPKKFKRAAPLLRSTLKTSPNEQHLARFQQTIEDPDNITHEETTKKKYYVVIRGYGDFTSADAAKKKLIEQKYNADIFYYEKERKFYVFVFQTSKSSEAYEEARNLKNYTKLKEARVLTVTESK